MIASLAESAARLTLPTRGDVSDAADSVVLPHCFAIKLVKMGLWEIATHTVKDTDRLTYR